MKTESQEGILSHVPFATSELGQLPLLNFSTLHSLKSDRMHLPGDACSQHLSTHLSRNRVGWHQIPLDPLSMGPGGMDGMDGMVDMAGGNPVGGNPAGGKPVGGNPLGGKPGGMSPAHPCNGMRYDKTFQSSLSNTQLAGTWVWWKSWRKT